MKLQSPFKFILILSILHLPNLLKGQVFVNRIDINKIPRLEYCEIVGIDMGFFKKKLQVVIDFGQPIHWSDDMSISEDTLAEAKIFNTMIHALNFMSNNGWEYVDAYAVSEASGGKVYHYLMRKKKD